MAAATMDRGPTESARKPSNQLSVIVIGRNEEANIARTIESVLDGTACLPRSEIILVDSASTDRTTEIARNYPIGVLCLRPSWLLSAAAARYVGFIHTNGEYVMFLDGDMALDRDWLTKTLPYLRDHPEVAGVSGVLVEIDAQTGKPMKATRQNKVGNAPVEVSYFGGAALYRRSALAQVGTFNPYLISEEEPELCMRIRQAGYRLVCLPYPMATHYCIPWRTWPGLMRRLRRGYYAGFGQALRYHLGDDIFWMLVRERGYVFPFAGGLLLGLASLTVSVLWWVVWPFLTWLGLAALVFAAYLIKKRSLYDTLIGVAHRVFILYGTMKGFVASVNDPRTYPTNVEIIKPRPT